VRNTLGGWFPEHTLCFGPHNLFHSRAQWDVPEPFSLKPYVSVDSIVSLILPSIERGSLAGKVANTHTAEYASQHAHWGEGC
jgi:hypothetical protein